MNTATGSNILLWLSLPVLLWFVSLVALSYPALAASREAPETNDPADVVGPPLAAPADITETYEQNMSDNSHWTDIRYQARLKVATASIKSEESKIETEIVFINGLNEPVSVYWVDFKGKEVKYSILNPRDRYVQHTYDTHPWVVRRSSDNEIVGRAVGRVGKQTLHIRDREYRTQESARQDAEARTIDTTYGPGKVMYAAKRANVRSGPSTSHGRIDLLDVGERITVVGKIGSWLKLRTTEGEPDRFVYAPLVAEHNPATETYQGTVRDGRPHGRGVYEENQGTRSETGSTQRPGETWAAFSSHRSGHYGIAWGFPSKESAEDAARTECQRGTGEECHLGPYSSGQTPCIATMSYILRDGRTMHHPGYGETREDAISYAKRWCEVVNTGWTDYAPPPCEFVDVKCNLP